MNGNLVFLFLHFFFKFFSPLPSLHFSFSRLLSPLTETGRRPARAYGVSCHIFIHKQPSSANPQALPPQPSAALVAPSAAEAAPPIITITTTTTTTTKMQASSFHRPKH